jgi:hypothetical protein
LVISYNKCIRDNRVVVIHLYCHKLFNVEIWDGAFLTLDTLYSNVGYIHLDDRLESHIEVNCNVDKVSMSIREGFVTLHGNGEICSFSLDNESGKPLSPSIHPTNLRNFHYRTLDLYVGSGSDYGENRNRTPIYVGSPETIYYNIQDNRQFVYYQGNPVLISKNSPNFTLTHEP